MESRRREIRRAILDLGDARYGWDGHKALPARPDAIELASTLFGPLGPWGTKELDRAPQHNVSLNQDGTILVNFGTEGDKQLILTFECHNVIAYVRAFEDGDTSIEGTIVVPVYCASRGDLRELLDMIVWLCQE